MDFEPYYTPEAQAMHDQIQQEIMRAFDVKPWDIGLAPMPRWVQVRAPFMRAWLKLTRQL